MKIINKNHGHFGKAHQNYRFTDIKLVDYRKPNGDAEYTLNDMGRNIWRSDLCGEVHQLRKRLKPGLYVGELDLHYDAWFVDVVIHITKDNEFYYMVVGGGLLGNASSERQKGFLNMAKHCLKKNSKITLQDAADLHFNL